MTLRLLTFATISGAVLALSSCGDSSSNKLAASSFAPVPADATTTASGLTSTVLTPGYGNAYPTGQSVVSAHYTGYTMDGKVFDSSIPRGKPSEFPLNQVIAGWTEGLQLMSVGEKRRFWIPAALAYGNNPGGGKPAGDLIFDVELLGIR